MYIYCAYIHTIHIYLCALYTIYVCNIYTYTYLYVIYNVHIHYWVLYVQYLYIVYTHTHICMHMHTQCKKKETYIILARKLHLQRLFFKKDIQSQGSFLPTTKKIILHKEEAVDPLARSGSSGSHATKELQTHRCWSPAGRTQKPQLLLLFLYLVCTCLGLGCHVPVPTEDKKEHQIVESWRYLWNCSWLVLEYELWSSWLCSKFF